MFASRRRILRNSLAAAGIVVVGDGRDLAFAQRLPATP